MAFRERFQRAAAYAKVEWSPTAIGRSLGIRKQTVARWMDKGEPSGETIFMIADRWKVDARWLATNDGDMVPRVVMEPGAQYRAFTPKAIELAREFDELVEPAREHLQQQMKFLRAAQGGPDSSGPMTYRTSHVRKGTAGARLSDKRGNKSAPKKA